MGASHSGKHQLGPASAAAQQQQQPSPTNNNTKFGHSFRKGMGNMLLANNAHQTSSMKSSSSNKSSKTKLRANNNNNATDINNSSSYQAASGKINTSHHLTGAPSLAAAAAKENINKVVDQYYVPATASVSSASARAGHNSNHRQPSAMMNNYVTMQQQQANSRVPMVSSAAPMKGRALDENGNNGYGISSPPSNQTPTAAAATLARPVYGNTTSASNTTNNTMEMNSVHQQNHHHHHQAHNRTRSSSSSMSNAFNSAAHETTNQHGLAMAHHRNYQHQQQQQQFQHQTSKNSPTIQQQQQQQPPFHLSRAINTKTTSHVLNHHHHHDTNQVSVNKSKSKSNNSDCNSTGSSGSASSASDVAMQSSGRKLQTHSQQISSSPSPAAAAHHNQVAARNEYSPYQHHFSSGAGFVLSSPQQQRQQQQHQQHWNQQQRYAAAAAAAAAAVDPANTSFYSSSTYNDERYLPAHVVDIDCDTRHYYLRNSHTTNDQQQQQQPMQDPQPQPQGHYTNKQYQQQLIDVNHRDPYSSHMFQTSPPVGQLPIHYNRSYSFGSSLTLDSKKIRSQNPLASLFQPLTSAASASSSAALKGPNSQQYANTIQVTRRHRNKSGQESSFSKPPTATDTSTNGRSAPGSLKRIKSNLLSAQQASYEAMRTIDMYLIRQIARSCQDFEMEQKIELEIRLRELAAQLIFEARNEIDVLEVEKSLLTSDQRMNYYASQLEQQRKKLSNPSLSTDSGRGSKTDHATSNTRTGTGSSESRPNGQPRSDVIGAPAGAGSSNNGDTSSPSFSSLSNSQSPSKLSPVSGQSANGSQASFTSRSHHSRTGLRHSQSSSSGARGHSQRIRAKNKRREQLIQNLAKQHNLNFTSVIDSHASISVSEIRIPLMWRDVDHFKNRGDYKRFAVFCLLKIDSQIYDTQLITDVDRQVTDVTFDDFIVFNSIDYDFELTLEVYSCVYLEQFSFSSTPRKLKEKLTSSIGRAMGKRLATQTASPSYTKELEAYDKSYRFSLIASANLQLEDASNSVKTYDLVLMSPSAHNRHHQPTTPTTLSRSYHNSSSSYDQCGGKHAMSANSSISSAQLTSANTSKNANKNALPLFGHFCCRLFVRPDVFDKNMNSALI